MVLVFVIDVDCWRCRDSLDSLDSWLPLNVGSLGTCHVVVYSSSGFLFSWSLGLSSLPLFPSSSLPPARPSYIGMENPYLYPHLVYVRVGIRFVIYGSLGCTDGRRRRLERVCVLSLSRSFVRSFVRSAFK